MMCGIAMESTRKKKRGTEEIFLISNTTTNDFLFQQLTKIGNTIIIDSIDEVDTENIYFIRAVIFDVTHLVKDADISWIRRVFKKAFVVIHDPSAAENPHQRLRWFDAGSNMVSHDIESLVSTLNGVLSSGYNTEGMYTCPYCQFHTLTEDELREHLPTYHINWPNARGPVVCPICRELIYKPLQVHIHEDHGAEARYNREIGFVPQNRARLDAACLVVCRHPFLDAYLLAQTFGNEGYWLPGGFLEPGEGFFEAAQRECFRQCEISIEVKGFLGMSHTPNSPSESHVSLCLVVYAEPINFEAVPKSSPDFHTAGACWCTLTQLESGLRTKGLEASKWIRYHANGGPILPSSLILQKQNKI